MNSHNGELGLDESLNISLLLDIYSPLLTERQRDCTSLYYNEDLSLSEIAELTGITRQGVRDCIRKSVAHMNETEEKLSLLAKRAADTESVHSITAQLGELAAACPQESARIARIIAAIESLIT